MAGPESANNAATGGAFTPLLTLGIPANLVMAILLGAMMIHGMQPGPMLLREQPGLFWGAVTSMYLGNCMLLVLNLPLIGLWVKILKVPYPHPLSLDPSLLPHRGLQSEQQPCRSSDHGHLWICRLPIQKI